MIQTTPSVDTQNIDRRLKNVLMRFFKLVLALVFGSGARNCQRR